MSYLNVHLQIPNKEYIPIFVAELSEVGFESFQEFENKIEAYILEKDFDPKQLEGVLKRYKGQIDCKVEKIEKLEDQNWNALWESNFDPVRVGDRLIVKALFHEIEREYPYTITIQPKMSFGTGHHETTWLMLDTMLDIDFSDKAIFDYGAGTAILSIAAEKLRAKSVFAVDIDEWAYENAKENLELNDCQKIEVRQGGIELVYGKEFDCILANINKNVILQSLELLNVCLKTGGEILFSGLLLSDKEELLAKMQENHWTIEAVKERGNWIMIRVRK